MDRLNGIGPLIKDLLVSWDFVLGLVAGLVGAYATAASQELKLKGTDALLVEGALGMAILAVVLTALAILVSFIGDEYLVILERSGGVSSAFVPYKAIAVISCVTSLSAFATAFVWSISPEWLQIALFGLCSLLTFWALVGTGQLVFITANHGVDRADLMRQMRDAEIQIRQRKTS